MKDVHLTDVRRLKPGIRLAFLEGRRRYRDQRGNVAIDGGVMTNLIKSGQVKSMGGTKASSPDLLMFDKIVK